MAEELAVANRVATAAEDDALGREERMRRACGDRSRTPRRHTVGEAIRADRPPCGKEAEIAPHPKLGYPPLGYPPLGYPPLGYPTLRLARRRDPRAGFGRSESDEAVHTWGGGGESWVMRGGNL